jgi:DNA-binding transcriptional ArsR family regulator
MIDGTEREVLELLFDGPRSPTEVADELGVSVQTASRQLRSLADAGYASVERRSSRADGRGYKEYEAEELARVVAGVGGELSDRTLRVTPDKRAILSVWRVPQSEFHPVLLSYLFGVDRDDGVTAVVVYGSVARGEADPNSDVDLLIVTDPDRADGAMQGRAADDTTTASDARASTFVQRGGLVAPDADALVSEERFTVSEFQGAVESGSQFLGSVLDEGIVLYDPTGVVEDARWERAGGRVRQ